MSSESFEFRYWIYMDLNFDDDIFEYLEPKWIEMDFNFEGLIEEIILDKVNKSIEKMSRLFNLKLDSKYFEDGVFLNSLYFQLDADIEKDRNMIENRKKVVAMENKCKIKDNNIITFCKNEIMHRKKLIKYKLRVANEIRVYINQMDRVYRYRDYRIKLNPYLNSNNGLQMLRREIILKNIYLRFLVYHGDYPLHIKEFLFPSYPNDEDFEHLDFAWRKDIYSRHSINDVLHASCDSWRCTYYRF